MTVGKERPPEVADGGERSPRPNPPSPALRWIWVLECDHRILADDAVGEQDSCYCPACGLSCAVKDDFVYRDEDVSA